MAFADEIKKSNSERVTYVRFEPRRIIDSDLTLVSGQVYNMSWGYVPISITDKDGAAYTKGYSSNVASNEWFYDEESEILYINASSLNGLTLTYLITVTTGLDRLLPSDLGDSGSDKVIWSSRIKGIPRFTESMNDVINGVVSISSSPITLVNSDRKFNGLLTIQDSWFNIVTRMWIEVNGEFQLVFTGLTGDTSINGDTFYIPIKNQITKLKDICTMGDLLSESQIVEGATEGIVGQFHEKDIGKAVPLVIGNSEAKLGVMSYDTSQTDYYPGSSCMVSDREGVCHTYAAGLSFEVDNRGYVLCRTLNPLPTKSMQNVTTASGIYVGTDSSATVNYTNAYYDNDGVFQFYRTKPVIWFEVSSHNFEIGDSFHLRLSPGHPLGGQNVQAFLVVKVTPTEVYTVAVQALYDLAVGQPNQLLPYITQYYWNNLPAVTIESGGRTIPLTPGYDFNVFQTPITSGGHYLHYIVLTSLLEYFYNLDPISPENTKLMYRVTTDSVDEEHHKIVKDIIESSGLSVDLASITQAGSELSSKLRTQIPSSSDRLKSYIETLEDILPSTLGYVTTTPSGDIKYGLFNTPSTFDYEINHKDILVNTMKVSISGSDAVSDVTFKNPNYFSNSADDPTSYSKSSSSSSVLLDIKKSKTISHALRDRDDARLDYIFGLYSSRRVKYQFRVSTKFLTSSIGDKIKLIHDDVLNESGEVLLVVTKVSKSETSVTIEAIDFQTIG